MIDILDNFVEWYASKSPINKGKHTLIRLASSRHTPNETIISKTRFGAMMELDLSQFVDANIYYRKVYEKTILGLIKTLSEQYAVDYFLDIGANIGQHSLYASIACKLQVLAFEADKKTFRKLQGNVRLNKLEEIIATENIAITDENGFVDIVIPDATNFGMSHITRVKKKKKPTDGVIASRLDDIFSNTPLKGHGLIKIDVEGAEGAVLRGAESLLRSGDIKAAIVEIIAEHLARFGDTPQGVCKFMRQCGFIAKEITGQNTCRLNDCSQMKDRCDILFIHEPRLFTAGYP